MGPLSSKKGSARPRVWTYWSSPRSDSSDTIGDSSYPNSPAAVAPSMTNAMFLSCQSSMVDVVGETRHLFQAPSLRPLCHRIHWSHLFLRHSDIVCFLHSSSKFWTREQLFRYAVFDGWSFLLHGMNLFFRMKWSVFTRLFNVILPPPTLRARCWQLIASWHLRLVLGTWTATQCMCNMCNAHCASSACSW